MKTTKFSPLNVLPNMVYVLIMSAYTCHSGYVRIRIYVCNAHISLFVSITFFLLHLLNIHGSACVAFPMLV